MTTEAPRHLVLVGLMGAGKSTVGARCAARLGRAFVDTDELVVAMAGVPVDHIWAAEGEQGFRTRERAAVADAAASPVPLVNAVVASRPLSGSAATFPKNFVMYSCAASSLPPSSRAAP